MDVADSNRFSRASPVSDATHRPTGGAGQHRAPSIPDLLIAATAEIRGRSVLHVDKDFERHCCVDRSGRARHCVMTSTSASAFAGFRFPREVISVAVRWYLRYGLSYRDVEELLAERGVNVNHVTIYRWVQRCTPEFVEAARPPPSGAG